MAKMVTISLEQLEILKRIILFVAIDMMDDFARDQVPAKRLFHYKAMLTDISAVSLKRMGWDIEQNVAVRINPLASLP